MDHILKSFFSEILSPKTKSSRLLLLVIYICVIIGVIISLIFNEIKKKDITRSQLEIENNRILQIDKKIASLYDHMYVKEGDLSTLNIKNNLEEIEFLKSQRIEAVKSVKEIDKGPETLQLIFILISIVVSVSIVTFFSKSFQTNININSLKKRNEEVYEEVYEEVDISNAMDDKSNNFLDWIIKEELGHEELNGFDIRKARLLKEIYDISTNCDEKINLFTKIKLYINLDRAQKELYSNKHSELHLIFDDIQRRLIEECNRLNKQALINLFICFFIALILVMYIGYMSIFANASSQMMKIDNMIIMYIPRFVAIISLLTIFLYFTRLYKSNILDVKYYQNEITNVDIKYASLKISLDNANEETINHILKEYANVERNTVITKDQTTPEIEKIKLENEINKEFLSKFWDKINVPINKITENK